MTVLNVAGSVADAAISNVVEIKPLPDGTVTAAGEAVDSPLPEETAGQEVEHASFCWTLPACSFVLT